MSLHCLCVSTMQFTGNSAQYVLTLSVVQENILSCKQAFQVLSPINKLLECYRLSVNLLLHPNGANDDQQFFRNE